MPPDDEPLLGWETLAAQRPRQDGVREEYLDAFGQRDINRACDWTSHIGRTYWDDILFISRVTE